MNRTLPPPAPSASAARAVAPRRVRHEVRDGAAVIAFSAAASTGLALALMLLARLAG